MNLHLNIIALSQLKICRPPNTVWNRFLWMMRNVLKRMKNHSRFFLFLFLDLSWKFIENWGDLNTKMTTTPKIKIGKIWNLIFLSIPRLSCKFEHFKKNWNKKCFLSNIEKNLNFFLVGGGLFALPQKKYPGAGYIFFRIGGP